MKLGPIELTCIAKDQNKINSQQKDKQTRLLSIVFTKTHNCKYKPHAIYN